LPFIKQQLGILAQNFMHSTPADSMQFCTYKNYTATSNTLLQSAKHIPTSKF